MVDLRITHFHIYSFRLPLSQPLMTSEKIYSERSGLVIELGNDQGHSALGETSPLPGFSQEDGRAAQKQLEHLRAAVFGNAIPDGLEALCGGFDHWLGDLGLAPSVRFGFETAVLGLLASAQGVPLSDLLCDEPSRRVGVNGLLAGAPDAVINKLKKCLARGFRAFKLKVGRNGLDEDVCLAREVVSLMGRGATLRLDANRAWTPDQAVAFARQMEAEPIAYLEEPVGSLEMLKQLLKERTMSIPVALDESLLEMAPEDLSSWLEIKAAVLKPTLLGFEKTMRFARTAEHLGMTPVISSAFESGLGLTVLAHIASSLKTNDVPAGLDTLEWFAQDLLKSPLTIEHGELAVPALPNAVEALKDKLVQIVYDA
jgi:o-succinylbenzoate synthase